MIKKEERLPDPRMKYKLLRGAPNKYKHIATLYILNLFGDHFSRKFGKFDRDNNASHLLGFSKIPESLI